MAVPPCHHGIWTERAYALRRHARLGKSVAGLARRQADGCFDGLLGKGIDLYPAIF